VTFFTNSNTDLLQPPDNLSTTLVEDSPDQRIVAQLNALESMRRVAHRDALLSRRVAANPREESIPNAADGIPYSSARKPMKCSLIRAFQPSPNC
jgi:hypothetical protein